VSYELPDMATMAKYMHLLRRVVVQSRLRAYETDPQIADLLDAVENVPDLLMRWPDMQEGIVLDDLMRVEQRYPEWRGRFTRILTEGAPENWQEKIVKPKR
jgi:hypothetical protein